MRLNSLLLIAACVVVVAVVAAHPGRAAEPKRVTLADVVARARSSGKVAAARAAADTARAKETEVKWTWLPSGDVTVVGGPGPKITCLDAMGVHDTTNCISTQPKDLQLGFSSYFWRIDARATMPLYTFGKLHDGRRAAAEGARAADALGDAAANDAALDAAKAYFAVKLGRALVDMLDEGRGHVDDAIKQVQSELDEGKGDASEGDLHRLRAMRAEIDARISEARRVERTGLAGIRLFYGSDDVDVDDAPLARAVYDLPKLHDVREAARAHRPEKRAADAGAAAARDLLAVEKDKYWPDLVAVGQATIARAPAADDPVNVFANDPLNVTSFTAGIALRWTVDVGIRPWKVQGARADAARAKSTADYASDGVAADAERAWADASDAADRLTAARAGQKDAHTWLVATLQSLEAGLVEPKELGDAMLAYFQMRARLLQATFDWDVDVVALGRAEGEELLGGIKFEPLDDE